MKINTNITSMEARNGLYSNFTKFKSSLEKLSTGFRINKSSDDPAGLSISENLRSQLNGLNTADRNTQDGISALQVADGSLNEVSDMLQKLRELSVQASTSTITDIERTYLKAEFDGLVEEIDRVSLSTEFNNKALLDGTWDLESIQVGANNTANDRIDTTIGSIASSELSIDVADISTITGAQSSIDLIDSAIEDVNTERGTIGSYINRLEHTVSNIKNSSLNITAAESLIRDVDVAKEMYEFTKSQLMLDVGTEALNSSYKVTNSIKVLFGLNEEN